MAAFLVIGERRVRYRFFVILALLLGGIFYLFLRNQPAAAFATVNYGRLDVTHNGLAVVIRDETVHASPAYGTAVFLVEDGAAVEKGQPIAVLHKENFNKETGKELYDIQEKIVQYQQEQLVDQVIDSDIIGVNHDLQSLVSRIQVTVKNQEFTKLANQESKLRKLLSNKQKLLDLKTEPDYYLTSLYDKEASLMAQMKQWTIDIEAPASGFISFSLDGLEIILGPGAVNHLETEDYLNITRQTPSAHSSDNPDQEKTATAEAEQAFFRLVNPQSKWYAVLQSDQAETYLNKGDTIRAFFDGQDPISAQVARIDKERDHSLIVLEFTGHIDQMINKRLLPIRVQKTVEGFLLPEGVLKKSKGRSGIYMKVKDEKRFIETSIQAKQDGFVIVESVSDNQVIKLHDQVLTDKE